MFIYFLMKSVIVFPCLVALPDMANPGNIQELFSSNHLSYSQSCSENIQPKKKGSTLCIQMFVLSLSLLVLGNFDPSVIKEHLPLTNWKDPPF